MPCSFMVGCAQLSFEAHLPGLERKHQTHVIDFIGDTAPCTAVNQSNSVRQALQHLCFLTRDAPRLRIVPCNPHGTM